MTTTTDETRRMTAKTAAALRKPFPRESIGQVPRKNRKTGSTVYLDYVGHAAVTDRLLAVDPEWTWEPLALDERGLPALDRAGNLWIRLTVCGVTRIGVGDGPDAKQIIGDAIRNAAMRFGVALDLWAKEDLLAFAEEAEQHKRQAAAGPSVNWAPVQEAMASTGLDQQAVLDLASQLVGREMTTLAGLGQQQVDELAELIGLQAVDVPEGGEAA